MFLDDMRRRKSPYDPAIWTPDEEARDASYQYGRDEAPGVPLPDYPGNPAAEPVPLNRSLPPQPRDLESFLATPNLSPRPPAGVGVDASAGGGTAMPPPGVPLTPRTEMAGRAPTPPLRTYSPSYGKYQDEAAALPSEEEYLAQKKPRGLLGRIGHSLALGGKLLLKSGFNPLIAAAGAAYGAVDPNANNRLDYRTNVEPRSVGLQQRYLGQAGAEIGLENTVGDNVRADEQQRIMLEQQGELRTRQATLDEREGEMYPLRRRLMESQVTENEAQAKRALDPRARTLPPRWEMDESGRYVDLNALPPGTVKGYRPPQAGGTDPLSNYEAEVGPEAYGAQSWNDLIDNPEYGPAYAQALEAAKAFAQPGERPEDTVNMLVASGNVKLPPRQIPAYEYARKNPHPLKQSAAGTRNRDRRLGPRTQTGAPASSKTKLTAEQVKAYAEANGGAPAGWTPETAASYLRSTGKYIVP